MDKVSDAHLLEKKTALLTDLIWAWNAMDADADMVPTVSVEE